METQNISIKQVDDYKKIKTTSKVFFGISFLILISYLYVYIKFFSTGIITMLSLFPLSFLPYYITRKFYTYKNNNHKKQIKLGVVFIILSTLTFISILILFTRPQLHSSNPSERGVVPCIPEPGTIEC